MYNIMKDSDGISKTSISSELSEVLDEAIM